MTILTITRTLRPRDAYKAVDRAQRIATTVRLVALRTVELEGRWEVVFQEINGIQRSRMRRIPPFWDTDVGVALLEWNREHGGGLGGVVAGSRFSTKHIEDATMIRMAFS